MNHKLELPVGTTAEVFGRKVECKQFEGMACVGCFLYDGEVAESYYCFEINCTASERTDGQFIILAPVD